MDESYSKTCWKTIDIELKDNGIRYIIIVNFCRSKYQLLYNRRQIDSIGNYFQQVYNTQNMFG